MGTTVEPSIKGSVVQTTLDELRDLVQRGSLSACSRPSPDRVVLRVTRVPA